MLLWGYGYLGWLSRHPWLVVEWCHAWLAPWILPKFGRFPLLNPQKTPLVAQSNLNWL